MPPKKKLVNGRRMAPSMPKGETVTDIVKKQWVIWSSIGKGGFGQIYLAFQSGKNKTDDNAEYVIKIVSAAISTQYA